MMSVVVVVTLRFDMVHRNPDTENTVSSFSSSCVVGCVVLSYIDVFVCIVVCRFVGAYVFVVKSLSLRMTTLDLMYTLYWFRVWW